MPCVLLLLLVTACGGGHADDPGPRTDACSLISRSTAAEVLGSRVERTVDDSKDLGGVGSNMLECTWVGAAGAGSLVVRAYAQPDDGAGGPLLGIPGVRGDLRLGARPPYAADLSAGWSDRYRVFVGVAPGGRELDRPTLRRALKKAVTELKATLSDEDFEFHEEGS